MRPFIDDTARNLADSRGTAGTSPACNSSKVELTNVKHQTSAANQSLEPAAVQMTAVGDDRLLCRQVALDHRDWVPPVCH